MSSSEDTTASPGRDDAGLHLSAESELPRELEVGRGNVLTVYGWCFHDRARIHRLEFLVDGVAQPLVAHGMPRPDIVHRLTETPPDPASVYRSGFWGLLELREVGAPREVELRVRAMLGDGQLVSARLGAIRLLPGTQKNWSKLNGSAPRVAICMATFNPPPELFKRQIESIRAQTYENWTCLISDDASPPEGRALIEKLVGDDPRFRVENHSERLGHYRNFERALAAVPPEAGLVALSDQDDRWHPDKLATLAERISGDVTLAYSDTRVTDGHGEVLSATFWTERIYNEDDLGTQLLVNSVTGGAAMFRSDILSTVLPFPPPSETVLHDHWIGMVAMALGEVTYVDRPLYDYVQHGSAALGHESLRRPRRGRKGLAKLQALRSRAEFCRVAASRLSWARRGYAVVLSVETSATVLLMRAGGDIDRRKRRILRRYSRLERSPLTWVRLLIAAQLGQAKTLGSERFLVAGSLWRTAAGAVKRLRLPPPTPAKGLAAWLTPPLQPEEITEEEHSARAELR